MFQESQLLSPFTDAIMLWSILQWTLARYFLLADTLLSPHPSLYKPNFLFPIAHSYLSSYPPSYPSKSLVASSISHIIMKIPSSSSVILATLAISSSSSSLAAPASDAPQGEAGMPTSHSNRRISQLYHSGSAARGLRAADMTLEESHDKRSTTDSMSLFSVTSSMSR